MHWCRTFVRNEQGERVVEPVVGIFTDDQKDEFASVIVFPSSSRSSIDEGNGG